MKFIGKIAFFLFISIGILILCLGFGSVPLSFQDISTALKEFYQNSFQMTSGNTSQMILFQIRIPRLLMAFLGGGILSFVGILMQTITKNPLAEPYVLGISAGASAGAVSAIILHWFSFFGAYNVYVGAFTGAWLATALVLGLQGKSRDPVRLVLMGMGINAFFTAATTFMVYSSKNEAQVRSAMFWTTGSLSGIHYQDLIFPLLAFLLLALICGFIIKELDLLLLGTKGAVELGLNIQKFQILIILISSFSIGILVAKVGVIGFIGLIIPHLTRRFVGVKHKHLLLFGAFLGGITLMITDTIARTIFTPNELPIGVITGLVGAPIFIRILSKTRNIS
ncbi:MAG: iron ABC transporter permease [Tissierellia bacterium]|nr:iron ABC transporter permease [Tissierellia bacterium]